MKIKPEIFISSQKNIVFNKILITGSDESFIAYVKNYVIQNFKKRNFFVDFSNNYKSNLMGNLFSENKTLFVLSEFPAYDESALQEKECQSILVASPNGKKTKKSNTESASISNCLLLEVLSSVPSSIDCNVVEVSSVVCLVEYVPVAVLVAPVNISFKVKFPVILMRYK